MSCNFQKFFYDVPDVEVDVVDRQHCRLTICIELVELTNSETAAATPSGAGAKSLRSSSSLENGRC